MNGTAVATGAAALGSAITGGVLWAFSSFVMPALDRTSPPAGIAAMQAINRTATGPGLMVPFLGTAVVSIPLAIGALRHLDAPGARWRLAGSALALATVAITIAFNVPRNDALATMDPSAPATAASWRDYVKTWTLGNHVRTVTALAAAGAFVQALRAAR